MQTSTHTASPNANIYSNTDTITSGIDPNDVRWVQDCVQTCVCVCVVDVRVRVRIQKRGREEKCERSVCVCVCVCVVCCVCAFVCVRGKERGCGEGKEEGWHLDSVTAVGSAHDQTRRSRS